MGDCETYCEHGGICILESGHEELHDTGYCRFPDAESVTKAVADERLMGKPGGALVLLQEAMMLGAVSDDEDSV